MAKFSEVVVTTDKGALKPAVREMVKTGDTAKVANALADLGYKYVEDKGAFVKTRKDANGTPVYTVLTMTVSLKHPTELAVKTAKPKADTETIEIE